MVKGKEKKEGEEVKRGGCSCDKKGKEREKR